MAFLMLDKDTIEQMLESRITEFSDYEAFSWLMLQIDRHGSYYTGRSILAKTWGWSDGKVRRFMERLVKLEQVVLVTSGKGTIVHWGKKTPQVAILDRPKTDLGPTQDRPNMNNINEIAPPSDRPKTDLGPTYRPLLDTKNTKILDTKIRSNTKIKSTLPAVVPGFRQDIPPVGDFKNVFISIEEGTQLVTKFGRDAVIAKITSMSSKINDGVRKYRAYKNHAVTIRGWLEQDASKVVRHVHEHRTQSNADVGQQNADYVRMKNEQEDAENLLAELKLNQEGLNDIGTIGECMVYGSNGRIRH